MCIPPLHRISANVGEDPVKLVVRGLTLLGALVAYAGLAAYVIWETSEAKAKTAPMFSDVQTGALGALAIALGAGYATVLGIPAKPLLTAGNTSWERAGFWDKVKAWISRLSERLTARHWGDPLPRRG